MKRPLKLILFGLFLICLVVLTHWWQASAVSPPLETTKSYLTALASGDSKKAEEYAAGAAAWAAARLQDLDGQAVVRDIEVTVSVDNGLTWQLLGDGFQGTPVVNRPELWTRVLPGQQVKWQATLSTTNQGVSPKVNAQGELALTWEANAMPYLTLNADPWYYTTEPTFSWTFSDPDPGGYPVRLSGDHHPAVGRRCCVRQCQGNEQR